jgi:hypothetical protein
MTAVTIIHRRVDIRGNVMAWSRIRSSSPSGLD